MKTKNFNIKVLIVFFLSISLVSCMKEAKAQKQLLSAQDSIVDGVDTIASITSPNGFYQKGAFTITNATTADTLRPQALYSGTTNWVTTSVKSVRTQSSDTTMIIAASSWPVDYEINDPCIIGFRLLKTNGFVASRKVYIYFRFRR